MNLLSAVEASDPAKLEVVNPRYRPLLLPVRSPGSCDNSNVLEQRISSNNTTMCCIFMSTSFVNLNLKILENQYVIRGLAYLTSCLEKAFNFAKAPIKTVSYPSQLVSD